MKIFSLETKKHLVIWSVVLGFFISIYFNEFYLVSLSRDCRSNHKINTGLQVECWPELIFPNNGFPFHFISYHSGRTWNGEWADFVDMKVSYINERVSTPYIANILFWILVAFIILSLVRYFRKKKVGNQSKLN